MAVNPMAVISQTSISSNCILSIPLKPYRRRISPENQATPKIKFQIETKTLETSVFEQIFCP
jgi:hypothetical protein